MPRRGRTTPALLLKIIIKVRDFASLHLSKFLRMACPEIIFLFEKLLIIFFSLECGKNRNYRVNDFLWLFLNIDYIASSNI